MFYTKCCCRESGRIISIFKDSNGKNVQVIDGSSFSLCEIIILTNRSNRKLNFEKKAHVIRFQLLTRKCIWAPYDFRRAVKPVYSYGLRLDFRDRFRYLSYSCNLTLERYTKNSSQILYIREFIRIVHDQMNHNNHFRFSLPLKSIFYLRKQNTEYGRNQYKVLFNTEWSSVSIYFLILSRSSMTITSVCWLAKFRI